MNNITFNTIKEAKEKIIRLENEEAIKKTLEEAKNKKDSKKNHFIDELNKKFKNILFKGSKITRIDIMEDFFLKSKPFKKRYFSFDNEISYDIYFYYIPTKLNIITENNSHIISLTQLLPFKNIEDYEKNDFIQAAKNLFNIKEKNDITRYFFYPNDLIFSHIKDVLISEKLYQNKDKIYIEKKLKEFRDERFNKEKYENIKKLLAEFFKEYYFKEILENNTNFSIGFKKRYFKLTYIDNLIYNLLRNKNIFHGMENIKQQTLERRFFLERNIINLFNYFENGNYFYDFLLHELINKDKRFNFVKDIKKLAK